MKMLDLFSGIGGFSLAAHWAGIDTVAFCEKEPYCQKVLKKNFPDIPIFSDIKNLKRSDINGTIDIITGGFPCQPFSIAGRKKGTEDDRDLWPEMLRVIQEFKPTWIIGENVANFVNMAFQRTKTDLESEGYEVQPFIIPACGVNAPHKRDRVWIVAHADNERFSRLQQSNTNTVQSSKKKRFSVRGFNYDYEMEYPNIPKNIRMDDGLSHRVDRVKGLGNAIVPQVAYQILKGIKEI